MLTGIEGYANYPNIVVFACDSDHMCSAWGGRVADACHCFVAGKDLGARRSSKVEATSGDHLSPSPAGSLHYSGKEACIVSVGKVAS